MGRKISHTDLVHYFHISIPQATNDLKCYTNWFPENIDITKDHKVRGNFEPVFIKQGSKVYLKQLLVHSVEENVEDIDKKTDILNEWSISKLRNSAYSLKPKDENMGRKRKYKQNFFLWVLWFVFLPITLPITLSILSIRLIFKGICSVFSLIAGSTRFTASNHQKSAYKKRNLNSAIGTFDHLSGYEFEHELSVLFQTMGCIAEVTKGSGDYGADLLVYVDNYSIAVQAKQYSEKVNLKAVQEVASAKSFYATDLALVVTNNYFEKSAKELAGRTDVFLWDRDKIVKILDAIAEGKNSGKKVKLLVG